MQNLPTEQMKALHLFTLNTIGSGEGWDYLWVSPSSVVLCLTLLCSSRLAVNWIGYFAAVECNKCSLWPARAATGAL